MSRQQDGPSRGLRGTIRRRLLVNATVDPDEAALRLPRGLRPHITEHGTVVGCCLLEIDAIRADGLPAFTGRPLRATAHRISAEWDDPTGTTVTGVYVPVRHTDSHLAVAIGGRWFPGVHEHARIEVFASAPHLRWTSRPTHDPDHLGIRVAASMPANPDAGATVDSVGTTCLGASIGVSPDHRGVLEAARMEPAHRKACEVIIEDLDSPFLDSFSTAKLSTSYLMRDADVRWTRTEAPRSISTPVPA